MKKVIIIRIVAKYKVSRLFLVLPRSPNHKNVLKRDLEPFTFVATFLLTVNIFCG